MTRLLSILLLTTACSVGYERPEPTEPDTQTTGTTGNCFNDIVCPMTATYCSNSERKCVDYAQDCGMADGSPDVSYKVCVGYQASISEPIVTMVWCKKAPPPEADCVLNTTWNCLFCGKAKAVK